MSWGDLARLAEAGVEGVALVDQATDDNPGRARQV